MNSDSEAETARLDDDNLVRTRGSTRPVSLRDVAKAAKVSVATVSMVLNENPRISRATHIRVSKLIEKLGYRPNRLAQSLSSKYTRVLAIMLPVLRHTFADAYFGELISGISDKAGRMGYKIMLEQAKPDFIKERQHIELYERRFIDGMIAMGCNDRQDFLRDFTGGNYPLVVCDNYFPSLRLNHVVCDYRSGAEQVMNYLLQLGHKRIGFIHAGGDVQTSRDVADVYKAKLRAAGIEYDAALLEDGMFTEVGGAEAAEKLLARNSKITAMFAGNDKMAIGAMHFLSRRGLRVPQDVSVVGFDDLQSSAFVIPGLTTLHLPLYEVGAAACERLLELIQGGSDPVAQVLPTHLVVRESTAQARSND